MCIYRYWKDIIHPYTMVQLVIVCLLYTRIYTDIGHILVVYALYVRKGTTILNDKLMARKRMEDRYVEKHMN